MLTTHLDIITPERVVYSDDVEMVIVPGVEGELGILPHHAPLFTKVKPGEITIKKADKEIYLAITGGFLEVLGNKVTILADYAIRAEEIEEKMAEEAKRRAEEAMREKKSKEELVIAEAELRRALLELRVARRRKAPKTTIPETS